MKPFTVSKFIGAGILALGLTLTPLVLPASAQQNNQPNVDSTPLQETEGKSDNFGWLGLIGLVGLANLLRKRKEPTYYRDPNVDPPSDYR